MARIASDLGSSYELIDCAVTRGELSGRLMNDRPAVGDFVEVRLAEDLAIIERVLPRRTVLVRRAVGRGGAQVLAANVDVVLIVTAVGHDFSPRRVERGLAIAREAGVAPVVVLSKMDRDAAGLLEELHAVAGGAPVVGVSAATGAGLDELRARLGAGVTAVLLGSSGVGKSTIVNALLGQAARPTAAVRDEDDKGRHTTTRRALSALPGGGFVIDTPGIRELGLVDAADGVADAFPEIAELAAGCRFRDCAHDREPGCAVTGVVAPERLHAWRKLLREAARRRAKDRGRR